MRKCLFLFISLLTITLYAGNENTQQKLNGVNKNFFIQNTGQWPSEVKYLAKVGGMNAWITNSGVVYDYYKINRNYSQQQSPKLTPDKQSELEQSNTSIKGHIVKMQLVDVNVNAVCTGDNRQEGYYNYFLGNDQTKWAGNVPLYGNVAVNEIYPKINVKYYFDGNNIRYDYIVKPGADISRLKMKFEGQESVRVNESGELVIKTSLGEVTNGKLYSYQNDNGKEKEVFCKFAQDTDGSVNLAINDYDKTKDLIIDPLIYSTFIGGSNDEWGSSISTDAIGNAYITGSTISTDYPTTAGAYQTTIGSSYDIFVTKINPTGSALVYSTFIGGSGSDAGASILTDANSNVYVTGSTKSSNYPTTTGALQTTFGGGQDVFVTKLTPEGSGLIFSTFIGGSLSDYSTAMAMDTGGNIYLTGQTVSANYPITPGAYQTTLSGGYTSGDAFITKLNPSGSALIFSTFIGGSSLEKSASIAVDTYGNSYITGLTLSSDYPTTPGAFQTTSGGGTYATDVFVTKLNSGGSALVYSTYIGRDKDEGGRSIAIDAGGNAFITGYTTSPNYPTTPGAFQTTLNGYLTDAFVTELNASGSTLVYSTLIGGNNEEYANSIFVDAGGSVYIAGSTRSENYPITPGANQTTFGGSVDVFVTKLNTTGSSLVYSTYIGGSDGDGGASIVIDNNGNAFITGNTLSTNYPVTSGVFQAAYRGGSDYGDAFITKLHLANLLLTSPNGGESWIIGSSHDIKWESNISSNIKIEYSTNNGSDWTTITGSVPSITHEYSWIIPNTLSTTCKIRITALDSTSQSDISDGFFTIGLTSSINDNNLVPLSNNLSQNYPNPFNPQTTISYSVAQESNVVIKVYDILGKEVAKLLNEGKKAGAYNIQFNASKLSSGMYFYTIQANSIDGKQSFRETKKMLLLK
ncbi:MAG: SBBP repeat-containing protein [Bacteroidota bacterium]|nr:SBBP repeat-containing protein [Bacteroidota bacterium]